MSIKYTAYTWQGDRVNGVLDVDREDEARELLHGQELIPYRLTRTRPLPSLSRLASHLLKPKPKELVEFTRGVSSLLGSGIPLREALIILRNESSSLGLREVIKRVIGDIEEGMRFSDAVARHPSIFSSFYIRILQFGETTGNMASAMQEMAENLEKSKTMRDKVTSALVYPMLSLVVAVAVAIILITFSIPALIGLLEDFGGELPSVTKLLITIADFTKAHRLHILGGAVGGAALAWAYFRTYTGARTRDRILLRVPVVGGVLMQSALFTFTSTFSTLLQAGIPTAEALRLSRQSLSNQVLRERLDRIIRDVNEGVRLGAAFRDYWPSPQLLSQAIVTGEASGTLAVALRGLAEYYEQESVKAVSSATELIQPVVIILVAGLVGFVAMAVMSGIYSALNSIE